MVLSVAPVLEVIWRKSTVGLSLVEFEPQGSDPVPSWKVFTVQILSLISITILYFFFSIAVSLLHLKRAATSAINVLEAEKGFYRMTAAAMVSNNSC